MKVRMGTREFGAQIVLVEGVRRVVFGSLASSPKDFKDLRVEVVEADAEERLQLRLLGFLPGARSDRDELVRADAEPGRS